MPGTTPSNVVPAELLGEHLEDVLPPRKGLQFLEDGWGQGRRPFLAALARLGDEGDSTVLETGAVRRAVAAVEPFAYRRIYGFMFDLAIMEDGKEAVRRSADRYLRAIGADSEGG